MSLYRRYLDGETAEVHEEIEKLGVDAFLPQYQEEVKQVLTETFQRVAYNLQVIQQELKKINYRFSVPPEEIYHPGKDTSELIEKLNTAAKPFGYLPLSLQYFFKLVGGVNLCWDYQNYPEIPWPLSDPMEIDSLDVSVHTVQQDWWKDYIGDNLKDPKVACAFLEVAADVFHKDNISGGPPYAVLITNEPSVDSAFMNEKHQLNFIQYLRLCFENVGFPGMEEPNESFRAFKATVKPRLRSI